MYRETMTAKECEDRGQALFAEYQAKYRGMARQGSEALIKVEALGRLPRTAANTAAIRSLLVSKVTLEEKKGLVRLLGRQYAPANPTGMNHLILNDLKHLANAPEPHLAIAATYSFSRLGYFPDWPDVLLAAKNRGLFDDDAYYGEVAHVLLAAQGADQVRLAQILRGSRNWYARDILATDFNRPSVRDRVSDATRAELLPFFESVEPRFSVTANLMGPGSDYANWLAAVASLRFPGADAQAAEFMMRTLNEPHIDPRKIMAVLGSEHGAELMKRIGDRKRFQPLLQYISIFPKQHPSQSANLQMHVDQVSNNLSQYTR